MQLTIRSDDQSALFKQYRRAVCLEEVITPVAAQEGSIAYLSGSEGSEAFEMSFSGLYFLTKKAFGHPRLGARKTLYYTLEDSDRIPRLYAVVHVLYPQDFTKMRGEVATEEGGIFAEVFEALLLNYLEFARASSGSEIKITNDRTQLTINSAQL
jgi:hypothetical protein